MDRIKRADPIMKFDPQKHHRRSIRLKGYDYSQGGGYFITVDTFQRACIFGEIVNGEMRLNEYGRVADECWLAIPGHYPNVELGAYVIMPNHVHGNIFLIDDNHRADADASARRGTIPAGDDVYRAPTPPRAPTAPEQFGNPVIGSIPTIVRTYKAAVTRCLRREFNLANIWQRNYYEHVIRNNDEWDRIHRYIESNPCMWEQDDENPMFNKC